MESPLGPYPTDPIPRESILLLSPWGSWFSKIQRLLTAASHISDTAVFAAVASKTITFDVAQKDTNYQIALSWDTLTGFIWNNKTVNGFDIVSVGGAITGNVDWVVVRRS